MKTALIVAVIVIPLAWVLYYLGFAVTKAGVFLFIASRSLPTRWEGRTSDASGYMRRNFVVSKRYSALCVEIETSSGSMGFEIEAPDGSRLSPASGAYGRDRSILIDVSRLKRCSVTLRMDHFSGTFHIALQ
ncbi:MAG: hypothetical protein HFF29_01290 [Oscillospiraceae bacterium]|nr:hypothetical protein [Oscillospiraceae bacterium]